MRIFDPWIKMVYKIIEHILVVKKNTKEGHYIVQNQRVLTTSVL